MKNIIVISDLHADRKNLEKIKAKLYEADHIFFCGDGIASFLKQVGSLASKSIAVMGNCDGAFSGDDKFVEIEGVKIMVTHGNCHGVKSNLYSLAEFCKNNGVDVAFFGHTHIACMEEVGGVKLINPGAISNYIMPTYFYGTVSSGKLFGKIVEI